MILLKHKQSIDGVCQLYSRSGIPDAEYPELSYKGKDFLLEMVDANSVTKEAL